MRLPGFSWLLSFSFFSILSCIHHTFVYGQCLDDQKSLLLHLKHNLSFSSPSSLTSWDSKTDCCSFWEGVECDPNGYVWSLDLTNKSIIGGVESWNTTLFQLKYLTSLNLSSNKFNSIPIPSGLNQLTNLMHLNLSKSGFAGQIPVEIARMKRLVSLDLSTLFATMQPLKLENPDLKTLVGELLELRELYLDGVNISLHGEEWCQALSSALPNLQALSLSNCFLSGPLDSSLLNLRSLSILRLNQNNLSTQVSDMFGDFSNLTSLHLSACGLLENFPERILQLPLLQSLDLSINPLLQGSLPRFPRNGSLESLVISNTNFSGKFPESVGNLRFLSKIHLANCGFSGPIPSSISNLTRLQFLDLSSNDFTGALPYLGFSENLIQVTLAHNQLTGPLSSSQWSRCHKLVNLILRNNSLNGTIPSILLTLPSLQKLDLSQNQFTGKLPEFPNGSSLMLDTLDFSNNMLEGQIPLSLFNIINLKIFSLSSNNLNGTLHLKGFQSMRNLSSLDLSDNKISINSSSVNSALFPQVDTLNLGSCNLRTFPEFLSNQSRLNYLDLSNNQIRGKIPNWLWKVGNGSLAHLNLSANLLENPDQPFPDVSFNSLTVVDLHSNLLQGPIPIMPPSASVIDYSKNKITSIIPGDIGKNLSFAIYFSLSDNLLRGEIPLSICEAKYLQVLDLSNNSLSGSIPKCLGNLPTLRVMDLRSNGLNGNIPESFPEGCSLRTLDLNGNRVEGKVSKSLSNCTMLEVLDLGNNQIHGLFPCWVGELPHLRVLVLRSNNFNGSIPYQEVNNTFQTLQIIDLSSNNFTGNLPSEQFLRWKGMMTMEESGSKHKILRYWFLELSHLYYQDSVTVTSKGQEMELVKILTVFSSIDISNNKFHGEIPVAIGNLTSLYVLNLSQNGFTGSIPSSLGQLKQLESLDLSANKLNGSIPSQLTGLTFLSKLNLSFNQLVGSIPVGAQFQTFDEDAYEGNDGLCGPPTTRICRNASKLAPSSPQKPSKATDNLDWKSIITGLGFGGGAALVVAPLWFWTEGRKWYDKQAERWLRSMFPSTALLHNMCDDCFEEELAEEDKQENEVGHGHGQGQGRYCVFCTKVDIRMKRVIHNPKCNCHGSPQNSSSLL